MAQINVKDLTFGYESAAENVFEHVNFSVDTNWKLGFAGRNGKGKTTFLKLLMGEFEYSGKISTTTAFDYFPYRVTEAQRELPVSAFMEELAANIEDWRVLIELDKLNAPAEILYRRFKELSNGEQTKALLAVLFSRDNYFLLIDEPTNHLDAGAREEVKEYLKSKKGFILVSHDRDLLDACIDHILVLNRSTIEVQAGTFSSWWENKARADAFHESENEKHLKEIGKLKEAAKRADRWASKSESSKIGYDPIKEPDRSISTRSHIGAKTKKMEKQKASFEKRIGREIEEKEGLLNDIEEKTELKFFPTKYFRKRMIYAQDYTFSYTGGERPILSGLNLDLDTHERLILKGGNGCGKSTLIKAILAADDGYRNAHPEACEAFMSNAKTCGTLEVGSGLTISYICQDTSQLKGSLSDHIVKNGLDETLFKAVLRQMDFDRSQFTKNMEEYSEGQKKKVLIASSLVTSADLYIWDEPLNYIDVFSRMQLEELILKFEPSMILVEHDARFTEKVGTRELILQ